MSGLALPIGGSPDQKHPTLAPNVTFPLRLLLGFGSAKSKAAIHPVRAPGIAALR